MSLQKTPITGLTRRMSTTSCEPRAACGVTVVAVP
jgi:hypothetical protein